jgi:hypothetical protein
MNFDIANAIESICGKKFCSANVGKHNRLSIGFGEKTSHNIERLADKYLCEWRIGTYYSSWRIIRDGKIILGSNDSNDFEYLNSQLNELDFKEIVEITNYNPLDVQVVLKNDMIIQFINTVSDEDETFHMFCPENLCVVFTTEGLWKIGLSNAPWSDDSEK